MRSKSIEGKKVLRSWGMVVLEVGVQVSAGVICLVFP